jgi:hypothetical protein
MQNYSANNVICSDEFNFQVWYSCLTNQSEDFEKIFEIRKDGSLE